MLFNTLDFLLFFPIVLLLYSIVKKSYRWLLLLIASYYFYMSWNPVYILLILFSTLVDYYIGISLGKINNQNGRLSLLIVSICTNLGILFFFKYLNFFNSIVYDLSGLLNFDYLYIEYDIILPVGISFYTFQTLSYTIEVYRRHMAPIKNFGVFSLYVSFFPQLVAGPIERPQNLFPQLQNLSLIKADNLRSGLRLMLWGLFKKMVIADRTAFFVNEVFNQPNDYHGLSILIAMIFFAFQIYCDFSGYSDIAIGAARIFGIDLMKNFNTPYFSLSIREFWSRWHISLSTWFRDYLYIPLGGNRKSLPRWILNLFITFVISGIWHGANWTFIVWGAIHGAFISVESLMTKYNINYKSPRLLRVLFTFSIVTIAWVFFRANSLSDAQLIFYNLLDSEKFGLPELYTMKLRDLFNVLIPIPLIVMLITVESLFKNEKFVNYYFGSSVMRLISYVLTILLVAFYGVFRNQSDFIYFQF